MYINKDDIVLLEQLIVACYLLFYILFTIPIQTLSCLVVFTKATNILYLSMHHRLRNNVIQRLTIGVQS